MSKKINNNKSKNILIILFVIIFSGIGTFFLLNSFAATSASIYLNPSTSTVAPLTEFTVDIEQDSGTENVNGVNVELSYDATKLDVVSVATAGSPYKTYIPTTPTGTAGVISFSAAAFDFQNPNAGGYVITGKAKIATIRFKSKTTAGAAEVKFQTGTKLNKPIPDDTSTPDVNESSVVNLLNPLDTNLTTGNARGGTYTIFIDTAPTSSVANPVSGAKVKGTITLTANASDVQGVKNVQFKIGSNNVGNPSPVLTPNSNGTYSASWDSKTVADGNYSITAVATDTGNQITTSSPVTFSVDNTAPNTTITSSNPGSTDVTSATFAFNSSETNSTFECQLDNAAQFTPCTTGKTYSGLAVGSHTFNVRAIDSVGNIDTSPATQTWTVTPPKDTTKPTVSVTAPTAGATVLGTSVPVSATADDNVGVTNVIFYLDYATPSKGVLGQDATAPYALSPGWNTSTLANGSHTITAEAYDKEGNTAISTVTVTVNNPPPPVDDNPPSIPKNLRSTGADDKSISLKWDESTDTAGSNGATPSGLDVYKLFRSSSATGQFNLIDGTLIGLTKVDTGLTASTKYYYKIQAFDKKGLFSDQSPALEVSTTAAPIPIKGDVNGDRVVDIDDLSELLSKWKQNYPPADFYKEDSSANIIDISDLSILLVNWTRK